MTNTFNNKAVKSDAPAAKPAPRLQDICPCYRPKM